MPFKVLLGWIEVHRIVSFLRIRFYLLLKMEFRKNKLAKLMTIVHSNRGIHCFLASQLLLLRHSYNMQSIVISELKWRFSYIISKFILLFSLVKYYIANLTTTINDESEQVCV
jgi:hypothetical protein